MNLHEYQSKLRFAEFGIPIPQGKVAHDPQQVYEIAKDLGRPVVVKAQVLTGGRGKAGGVKLAANEQEAREHASNILGLDIRGHVVHELWIEKASDIADEYYASILLDRSAKAPLLMFSTEGGVDIEEVAEKTPDKLIRHHIDALEGLSRDEALDVARRGGADADVVEGVADLLVALWDVWSKEDATLTEINPIIVTPDRRVKALDAKVTLDNNALFRHPDNAEFTVQGAVDPIEERAKALGLQYVALDGDIGIMGNGAGLAMSTLDVVAQAGGDPANFLDAAGGSNAEVIKTGVETILSNPKVKAVLLNIFGGITRCDEVARGVIAALSEIDTETPFVVRLDGTNDAEGRRLLEEAAIPNVHPAKTMNEAAEMVVALAKERS